MGELHCRIEELLNLVKSNKNQLSKETDVRRATLYLMERNKLKRLEVDYAIQILDFLNDQAKKHDIQKEFDMQDLFTYTYKKKS